MTYQLKKHYESIFIEVDKTLFNTNCNTIIRQIYESLSSNLRIFNIELEKLLIKIKNENKYAYIMEDLNMNTILETKQKLKIGSILY